MAEKVKGRRDFIAALAGGVVTVHALPFFTYATQLKNKTTGYIYDDRYLKRACSAVNNGLSLIN